MGSLLSGGEKSWDRKLHSLLTEVFLTCIKEVLYSDNSNSDCEDKKRCNSKRSTVRSRGRRSKSWDRHCTRQEEILSPTLCISPIASQIREWLIITLSNICSIGWQRAHGKASNSIYRRELITKTEMTIRWCKRLTLQRAGNALQNERVEQARANSLR